MTGNEYQRLAARTADKRLDMIRMTQHALHGISAEVGEVASLYQHAIQEKGEVSAAKLVEELGDLIWFIAELATVNNIPMDYILEHNIDKLVARYPDGFDEQRSIHRHDVEGG